MSHYQELRIPPTFDVDKTISPLLKIMSCICLTIEINEINQVSHCLSL